MASQHISAEKISKSGLAIHRDGHTFIYNGKPVLLFGAGPWVIIPKLTTSPSTDYELIHRTVSHYRANANRATLFGFGNPDNMPWTRDSDGLYDLDHWNESFWERLHGYLKSAAEHGIVVFIQIFDHPFAKRGESRWDVHPFNPRNNINDMGAITEEANPREYYNVANTELMARKTTLLHKLLDETQGHNNIIYQLDNEHPAGVGPWADLMLNIFGEKEAQYQTRFLVSNMTMDHATQMDYVSDDRIRVIEAFHTYDTGGYHTEVALDTMHRALAEFHFKGGGKPVILGRGTVVPARGQGTVDNMRREWFTALISGAQIGSPRVIFDDAGDRRENFFVPVLLVVQSVQEFADLIPFWTMHPLLDGVQNAFAMRTTDKTELALYNPYSEQNPEIKIEGGILETQGSHNPFTVQWYDPVTRVVMAEQKILSNSDGSLTLTPPYTNPDWAVIVRK